MLQDLHRRAKSVTSRDQPLIVDRRDRGRGSAPRYAKGSRKQNPKHESSAAPGKPSEGNPEYPIIQSHLGPASAFVASSERLD